MWKSLASGAGGTPSWISAWSPRTSIPPFVSGNSRLDFFFFWIGKSIKILGIRKVNVMRNPLPEWIKLGESVHSFLVYLSSDLGTGAEFS